jgi:uncharacterized protein YecE (DUF72 family)
MSKISIGTSGFLYKHWKDSFYPSKLPQKDWFGYFVKQFDTVELNVSFYRLPKKEAFEKWRKIAGKSFVFAIKGSRYITHIKRLKDSREAVERFFEAASPLGSLTSREVRPQQRKNVVLWQLPPRFKANPERLEEFLKILPSLWRHAFEFRHESWLDKEVFKILKKYNAAIVFQDFPDWPRTEAVTADFVYLRFHGSKALYTSNYSEKELKEWSGKIKKWLKRKLDVYAYFNNDALGYATENAVALKALVLQ